MVTIDKTIFVCRIRAKLGGEGIGVLYNTEDTNLHRFIAHKFLSGQVPGPACRRRRTLTSHRVAKEE